MDEMIMAIMTMTADATSSCARDTLDHGTEVSHLNIPSLKTLLILLKKY